ncbi:hypothetical protein OPIT5_12105 [Opitutaceae bacterium TAV5]|nr:hypothetical protein OPIT5_12105 [Opitutaceae bacterium TAV5]
MKHRRLLRLWLGLNLVLCLALAAACVVARVEIASLAVARDHATAQNENRRHRIEERIRTALQARDAATADLAAIPSGQSASTGAGTVSTGPSAEKRSTMHDHERLMKKLRADPDYRRHAHRHSRWRVQEEYGGFFARQNLSPDEIEKLKELIIEKSDSMSDARKIAVEHGIDEDSGTADRLASRAADDVEKDIKTLLGPERFSAFKDVYHENRARDFASEIDSVLGDQMLPTLTAGQSAALVRSVLGLKQRWNTNNPKILADMAPLLTLAQLDAIAGHQKAGITQLELYMKISAEVRAAETGAAEKPE